MCIQSWFFHNQLRAYQVTLLSYDSVASPKSKQKKGYRPIPAKKMQGEEKNNNTWNTLRSRLLMFLGKESWAMVPRHPGWALYLPERGGRGERRAVRTAGPSSTLVTRGEKDNWEGVLKQTPSAQ